MSLLLPSKAIKATFSIPAPRLSKMDCPQIKDLSDLFARKKIKKNDEREEGDSRKDKVYLHIGSFTTNLRPLI